MSGADDAGPAGNAGGNDAAERARSPDGAGDVGAPAAGGCLRRLIRSVAIVLVAAVIAGAIVQFTASRVYLYENPPPGRMIAVDGYALHLYCEGSGAPTVLFDAGIGDSHLSWGVVQDSVAAVTRACALDRAGLGWSEPGPEPRTAARMVEELATVLDRAGEPGPYVLVGHSFGGATARLFAHRNAGRTAGLVLVDGLHENQFDVLPRPPGLARFLTRVAPVLARVGIHRLLIGEMVRPEWMSTEAYRHRVQQASLIRSMSAAAAEWASLETSLAQLDSVADEGLGELPLVALAAGRFQVPGRDAAELERLTAEWHALQRELASRSARGELRIVEGAGHYIHFTDPDAVIGAVLDVVRTARGEASAAPSAR